jgi:competence protein ComEC
MPVEPQLSVAFAPLALALIFRATSSRGTIVSAALTSLILMGAGFAIAKLRVEAVRAPVLAKSLHNAEITGVVTLVEVRYPKGQRLTISAPQIAGIAPDKTPAVIHVRTMSARSGAAVTASV